MAGPNRACKHRPMVVGTTRGGRADRATPGRVEELLRARRHLTDGGARLVTFTGPAGVGKSWAARRLAREVDDLGARSAFVHIAGARSYDDLLVSVAEGVHLPPGTGPLERRLVAAFDSQPHVVIVDGGDRLEGDPHPVELLLQLAPTLRVVATGLSPLHVVGERVVGLDPFRVPPPTAGIGALRECAAVQLFFRRAAQVDHDFDADRADVTVVGELCRRVHGLPLGIEILATRVAGESPAATLQFLDSGHEVTLAHTQRGDDPHHLSIRAALSASYDDLPPAAQTVLRRMAIFVGPASPDMLAPVVRLEGLEEPSYSDILDTLSDLVDRRLVELSPGPGEPAFVLVALLRDYARERLVAAGELVRAKTAHARAVISHALARSDAIEEVSDDRASAELARSEADLRAVLRHLVGAAEVVDGLRLAIALSPFVLRRGYDGFVAPALGSLLPHAREGVVPEDLLARAAMWKARLAIQFEGPSAAEEIRRDLVLALTHARRSGRPHTVLLGLSIAMQALPVTGDLGAASAAAKEGLPLAVASGDDRWAARFCGWVGMVANQAGREDEALDLAERGIEHMEACGDPRAQVLLALLLAGLQGDRAASLRRRLPPVDVLIEASDRVEPRYKPFLLRMAAGLALQRGDLGTAAARCADCLRLAQREASWHDLPFAVLILALVAVARGDLPEAARLHGMLSGQLETLRPGLPRFFYDEYVATLERSRAELGKAAFDAFESQGDEEPDHGGLTWALAYAVAATGQGPPGAGGTRGAAGAGGVPAQRSPRREPRLTPREREVLVELITGATNKEISQRLGMAPKTVMHHSVAIYRKLEVRGRAEATAWAFRNGVVS